MSPRVPAPVRWALVLPAAVAATFVVGLLQPLAGAMTWPGPVGRLVEFGLFAIASAAGGYLIVSVGARVAPARRFEVAAALLGLFSVSKVVAIVGHIANPPEGTLGDHVELMLCRLLAIACASWAFLQVRTAQRPRPDPEPAAEPETPDEEPPDEQAPEAGDLDRDTPREELPFAVASTGDTTEADASDEDASDEAAPDEDASDGEDPAEEEPDEDEPTEDEPTEEEPDEPTEPDEPAPWPTRRLDRWDVLLLVVAGAILVGVRVSLLLSMLPEIHQHEFTILGRFALDLSDGTAKMGSLAEWISTYQYGFHAEGTLATATVTAALAVPLGANGWAIYGSTIFFEVLTLVVFGALLLKTVPRPLAMAALLPLYAPPMKIVILQLTPSGNHSEFIWFPAAIALWLVSRDMARRPNWHWLVPAALATGGIVAYRLHIAMTAALLAAAVVRLKLKPALFGVGAVVLAIGATRQLGGEAFGFDFLMDEASMSRLSPAGIWAWIKVYVPYPYNEWQTAYRNSLLLMMGTAAFAAIRRREYRPVAVFALGWAVAGLGAPLILNQPVRRYHLQVVYAALLCGFVGLAALRGWWKTIPAIALGLVFLAGLNEQIPMHDTSQWAENRKIDTLALGQRLGVYHIEQSQTKYYQRMLDEKRYSQSVGAMPYPPRKDEIISHEYPSGPLADVIDVMYEHWQDNGKDVAAEFEIAGRGAWISGHRDLEGLKEFWLEGGVPQPMLRWLWRGATAEAALWGETNPPDPP